MTNCLSLGFQITKPESKTMRRTLRFNILIAIVVIILSSLFAILVTATQSPEPLTGNWDVRSPNADGTFRTTYLNLTQEGAPIPGALRVTQFFYHISESTSGAGGFLAARRDVCRDE